jgi:hypothetical protein
MINHWDGAVGTIAGKRIPDVSSYVKKGVDFTSSAPVYHILESRLTL